MATVIPSGCSNLGCDQPGTNKCSACKTTFYCGPTCQTAHWAHHKEECEGHLLKVGNAHLAKADGFFAASSWVQVLRYSDLALAKFNAMKKRPLEAISQALALKSTALRQVDRNAESLQCSKDMYNLWALARGPAHPQTIEAAFYLINALLQNHEYEDAEFYARTLWEIIHTNNHRDNDIPGNKREEYVAMAAQLLAQGIWQLAKSGGIPPEEKQKAGEEAIARARQALEMYIQLYGAENEGVAAVTAVLANVLDHFSDNVDDEVFSLYQQAIAIHTRVNGCLTANVAGYEYNLGAAYHRRAVSGVEDGLEQYVGYLKLALPHFRESARINTTHNHVDASRDALRIVVEIEERLREIETAKAAAGVED